MTEDSALIEALETTIRRLCRLTADHPIEPDTALWELGLDSVQVVELIFELEKRLDMVFPDDRLTAETFATFGSTLAMLRSIPS